MVTLSQLALTTLIIMKISDAFSITYFSYITHDDLLDLQT